ncbi:hypothetical protein J2T19_002056 [Paenibacillus tundrae]|uniref:DUF3899 domain-containing protein n=1 Tax=Paenibacillus tundrae TaxID=528187 RepID=A0ABT9WC29_9BACL|nr:hypothetical protein [Paenibacillus tundrae]
MGHNNQRGGLILRSSKYTPYYSYIGIGFFILTFIVNLSFKYSTTSDVGVLLLLSVSNAGLMMFTLLWGVFGIIELNLISKTKKTLQSRLHHRRINAEEYRIGQKSIRFSLVIAIGYLVLILIQVGYVILNWDEINI